MSVNPQLVGTCEFPPAPFRYRPYLRFFPDARRLQGPPSTTADAADAVLPGDKIETIYKFDLLNSAAVLQGSESYQD